MNVLGFLVFLSLWREMNVILVVGQGHMSETSMKMSASRQFECALIDDKRSNELLRLLRW
jgi:hypothetical protein